MMLERKPIDGALRRFLDEQAAATVVSANMTDDDRKTTLRARMLRAVESRTSITGLPNDVSVRDLAISSTLAARLFTPTRVAGSLPVLVYLHGGGWVTGSVVTHDPFCRLLSEAASISIVSVEYRVAPEYPYPAALEDTLTAVTWVAEHAVEWHGDATRLVLGGDSSGANLAAVAANRLCAQAAAPALSALLLLYPVTDHPTANHPSYTKNATGYGLEANLMRWFWAQYIGAASPRDTNVSPLRLQEVPPLPPTLIATAEYDVLRDEGLAYAEKLRNAGVAVTQVHAPDMHHNFAVSPLTVARFPQSVTALNQIAGWLRDTMAARPG